MNRHEHIQRFPPAVLFAFLVASVAAAESRLSISGGFVDRRTVEAGSTVSITVVVANSGDTPAQNCKIEIVPGSVQCEPSDFPLAPKQEQAVSCNYAPGRDGEVNLVAIGSWKEANALRTTGQLISQIRVTPPNWYKRTELQVLAAIALLVVVVLFWRVVFFGSQASFTRVTGALVSVSLVALVSGILFHDGVVIVSGLVLFLVCGLLMILGEKGTKRLLSRVQKAGPLEFSVAVERSRHFAVIDAREQDFKRPKERFEQTRMTISTLPNYIDLYRLKMYAHESRLVPHNTAAPASGFPLKACERRVWFNGVAASALPPDSVIELQHLYPVLEGYEELAELCDSQIVPLLDSAQASKKRTDKVKEAMTLLEELRQRAVTNDFVCPPNCLVILAHLQVLLGKKEAAFSILYQCQNEFENEFPANLVSNYALCHYLMILANDSYTALSYGDNALNHLRKLEKDFLAWKKECDRLSPAATGAFADHLKRQLEPYSDHKSEEIKEWLKGVRHGIKNVVAYTIATSQLPHREDDAKAYAWASTCYDPNDASYLDTMGFVKLTFGVINRDRAEVTQALRLFHPAAQEFNKCGTKYERKLIRHHIQRASDALRSADDWD